MTETKMGPELITEGSKYYQTLMQGSSKLNRGHRSDDSGRGSDWMARTRMVRAHFRLRQDDYGRDQGAGAQVAEAG